MFRTDYARGVLFALTTAVLWGLLPVAMQIALADFSPGSIVWFRFTFAFFALWLFLRVKGRPPERIFRKPPLFSLLAGLCLSGNYYYFLRGISASSPSNAAILIQTAPVLVVLIGVAVFRERFSRPQAGGLAIAAIGFFLFFRDQHAHALDVNLYNTANGYVLIAGVLWAAYMTFQKSLAPDHEAQQLNLLVYGVASLVLLSAVSWNDYPKAEWGAWALMLFLGMNTLLAYGFLAEAIKHIPLWLISVIVTLNPFITLVVMKLLPLVLPGVVEPERIGALGYLGAATAIGGVVLVIRKR
ncbi:DMT family transporter [Nitrospina gracilis]|uniref:DMT family transporter n=1 Tax=Nitrospina gracilis TaxID=35801 RepID=UPI001F433FCA|nr:DMT family transporter [Nitrospina gracilis]MCF8720164.1 drug/metabolite transporter (DMT)-like permease [Nitrospina gracilis Nb-211]